MAAAAFTVMLLSAGCTDTETNMKMADGDSSVSIAGATTQKLNWSAIVDAVGDESLGEDEVRGKSITTFAPESITVFLAGLELPAPGSVALEAVDDGASAEWRAVYDDTSLVNYRKVEPASDVSRSAVNVAVETPSEVGGWMNTSGTVQGASAMWDTGILHAASGQRVAYAESLKQSGLPLWPFVAGGVVLLWLACTAVISWVVLRPPKGSSSDDNDTQ